MATHERTASHAPASRQGPAGKPRHHGPRSASPARSSPWRCACGGGCARCGGQPLLSRRGDSQERAAEAMAARAQTVAEPGAEPPVKALAPPSRTLPRTLPRTVASTVARGGEPLPQPLRAQMEPALGADLGAVRLHRDGQAAASAAQLGARAYAVGPHIAFGAGQYAPHTRSGRHLIAHELAHTLQPAGAAPVQRYESSEHEDLGDIAMVELRAFLDTEEGKAWARKRQLDAATLVKQIDADPLRLSGGRIIAGRRQIGDTGKSEDVGLTPGQVIALAGDLYQGPRGIAAAASEKLPATPVPSKDEPRRGQTEIDKLTEAIDQERRGELSNINATYESITGGRYLAMAEVNDEHFAPLNRAAWRRLHQQALELARSGTDADSLQMSLLTDAAGGHFLTDAYAAGHLLRKNEVLAAIQLHQRGRTLRTQNPEAQLYAGAISLSGKGDQLVLKNLHDKLNREGFMVSNRRGMSWRTYGDAQLSKAPDTRRIAALAIFLSRQQIYAARRGETVDPDEVEALMPDDATLDRATAYAIAAIPGAASPGEIQGLIYRERGLAPVKFPWPLGVIAESNLATVASPGRERQLQDLQRLQQDNPSFGPLVAPQLTIFDF